MEWDAEFDFVVAGSGIGGLTAALTAHENRLKTLVLEKSAFFGGTSGTSGGVIWIPNNSCMKEAGIADSEEDAYAYVDAVAGNGASNDRKRAFVRRGPEAVDFLEAHSESRFQVSHGFFDYFMERPGAKKLGRSLDSLPAEGGAYAELQKDLIPRRQPSEEGKLDAGHSTNGRIIVSLKEKGVALWANAPARKLIVEDGRVVGLEAERDGKTLRIKANKGVLIAAGGFGHNKEMRDKYHFKDIGPEFSWAHKDQTGDTILMAQDIGAALDQMDGAWWQPMIKDPNIPIPLPVSIELAKPGSIIVNQAGKRFTNEAAPYVEYGRAVYESEKSGAAAVPAFFIFDQSYRDNVGLGSFAPGPLSQEQVDVGWMKRADTIEGLAEQLGLSAGALGDTVAQFNSHASEGKDPEYNRGEHAYDFYAPINVTIEKTLAPVENGPFYAVELWPGDLSTKGGVVCDENSRVLREDGSVIKGLYAAGNDAISVFGDSYSAGGCVNGEALVWGYLGALDAAGAD